MTLCDNYKQLHPYVFVPAAILPLLLLFFLPKRWVGYWVIFLFLWIIAYVCFFHALFFATLVLWVAKVRAIESQSSRQLSSHTAEWKQSRGSSPTRHHISLYKSHPTVKKVQVFYLNFFGARNYSLIDIWWYSVACVCLSLGSWIWTTCCTDIPSRPGNLVNTTLAV